MKRTLALALLLALSPVASAAELTKSDTADTWRKASAAQQAAFVAAWGPDHGVTEAPHLRRLENCMRDLAENLPEDDPNPTIDTLATTCVILFG